MADKKWGPDSIGHAVFLWLENRAVATIIYELKILSPEEGRRTADSINTMVNKVFLTDQTKDCPVQRHWTGEGMQRRVGHLLSQRERRKIVQAYNNALGMGWEPDRAVGWIAMATGRNYTETKEAVQSLCPRSKRQRGLF